MKKYSELDIDIMLGLDDIAHNRMYEQKNEEFIPIPNYGKRNPKEKCYCMILKRLGIKR
jgi:hypothetical protein